MHQIRPRDLFNRCISGLFWMGFGAFWCFFTTWSQRLVPGIEPLPVQSIDWILSQVPYLSYSNPNGFFRRIWLPESFWQLWEKCLPRTALFCNLYSLMVKGHLILIWYWFISSSAIETSRGNFNFNFLRISNTIFWILDFKAEFWIGLRWLVCTCKLLGKTWIFCRTIR